MSYRLMRGYWWVGLLGFSTRVKTYLRVVPKLAISLLHRLPSVSRVTPARRDRHRARPGDVGMVIFIIIEFVAMTGKNTCRNIAGATTP